MKFTISLSDKEYKSIENIIKTYDKIPVPKSFNTKEFAEAESVKISYGPMSIETDKKNTFNIEIEENVTYKLIIAAFIFIDSITAAAKNFIEKLMKFNPKGDVKPKIEYTYPNGDQKMESHNIDDSIELKPMGFEGSLVAKEYAIVGEPIDDEHVQIGLFGNGRYEFAKIANSKNKNSIANATDEAIAHLCGELKGKYNTNNVIWSQKNFDTFVDSHYNG